MRDLGSSDRESVSSRLRIALETFVGRENDRTVIEECRRCGTTREIEGPSCPTCGCDGVARYRIE